MAVLGSEACPWVPSLCLDLLALLPVPLDLWRVWQPNGFRGSSGEGLLKRAEGEKDSHTCTWGGAYLGRLWGMESRECTSPYSRQMPGPYSGARSLAQHPSPTAAGLQLAHHSQLPASKVVHTHCLSAECIPTQTRPLTDPHHAPRRPPSLSECVPPPSLSPALCLSSGPPNGCAEHCKLGQ